MRGETVGRTLSKPGIAGARMGKSVVFNQGINCTERRVFTQ